MVDPWRAGNFFTGDFIRFGTDAIQSVTQRLVTTVKITARPQFDVLPLLLQFDNKIFAMNPIVASNALSYYWVNVGSNSIIHSTVAPKFGSVTRNMIGGSPPPSAIILLDENGTEKQIVTNSVTRDLEVSTLPYNNRGIWYVGEYLEMVGSDGQKIYRITVNSSNVISVTLNRTEPERIADITISNGHAKPYDENLGVLFTEALINIGPISRRLTRNDLGYGGVAVPQIGKMEIQLADGDFNFLCSQSFDGREVYIQNGLETDPISSYRVIGYGITNYAEFDLDKISITFKDNSNILSRELQENTYAGTGGIEGNDEVKGTIKPLAYGRINHATPVLLDYNTQLYQLHDGLISGTLLNIYSGGILRPGDASSIPLSTLLAWNPSEAQITSGYYRWHNGSDGGAYFRLANNPVGALTVTFDGDTSCSGPFGSGNNNIANLIRALLQKGASEFVLDTSNTAELLDDCRQTFGIYITQPAILGDIINKILVPSGAFLAARRVNGLARVQQLRRNSPRAVIQESDYIEIGRQLIVKNTDIPPRSLRFGHNKSWTVLNESDLLGLASQTPDIKEQLQREYAYIEVSNPDALEGQNLKRFTTKSSISIDTFFSDVDRLQSPIDEMAIYLLHRLYSLNWIYTMTVKSYQFEFDLGDTVLLDINKWDLRNPTPVIIIEIVEESTIGMSSLEQGLTKLVMIG